MAAPTPTTEPDTLIAGDTAKWLKTLPDYPATAGWVLTYTLVNATTRITFNASSSGSDFLVNVPAATTAAWAPGSYVWRATVALSGEVYTVATGNITVQPTFAAASDIRSFASIALANVETYLKNSNNLEAAKYQIAGREIQKYGLMDLIKLRDKLRIEVNQEAAAANIARGLPDKRRIVVRFG